MAKGGLFLQFVGAIQPSLEQFLDYPRHFDLVPNRLDLGVLDRLRRDEEFAVAVRYLRDSELFDHPFLDPSSKITFAPVLSSTSSFEIPSDQMLNDFLMRLRPFLFEQDMFYWKDMLFRLFEDVVVDTDYLSGVLEFAASCFDGSHFRKEMEKSQEGKRIFDPDPSDKRWPRAIGLGEHQAYAQSGGNFLRPQDVKSWLFGKKYHHNYGMFMHYRSHR